MPIQKITIEEFLQLAKWHPVFDVRSPGEYTHAHIPGAVSLPLFSDEERKIVGIAYKQQGKQPAIKLGLDFFGVKMKQIIEAAEQVINERQKNTITEPGENLPIANCVLLHCWRGGMRSAGVAWLLDLYGFKVYTLTGGYKAYRKRVLTQFEKQYSFRIIGGYTGSGKTLILNGLAARKIPTVDLEALAEHKGSAFGGFGKKAQPKQEMFENLLATELAITADHKLSPYIFLEDESQRIGNLIIPNPLWHSMRKSPVYFIDIPFEERLNYIVETYGKIEKEELIAAIARIQKRLGGLETKNAVNHLQENNFKDCFSILLAYYDKQYNKGLQNRGNISALLTNIECKTVDTKTNVQFFIK